MSDTYTYRMRQIKRYKDPDFRREASQRKVLAGKCSEEKESSSFSRDKKLVDYILSSTETEFLSSVIKFIGYRSSPAVEISHFSVFRVSIFHIRVNFSAIFLYYHAYVHIDENTSGKS